MDVEECRYPDHMEIKFVDVRSGYVEREGCRNGTLFLSTGSQLP